MATERFTAINSIKNPLNNKLRGKGNVQTYDGIYEAIVVSTSDLQKNGRIKIRLINANANVDFIDENDPQNYLDITVLWSSPFAGATNIKDTVETGDEVSELTDPDKQYEGHKKVMVCG